MISAEPSTPPAPEAQPESAPSPETQPASAEEKVEDSPPVVVEYPPPPEPNEPASAWGLTLEEAFGPTLALDVLDFRRRLLELLERASDGHDIVTAHAVLAEFVALNKGWTASSVTARERLEERREMVEDCKIWAERLAGTLTRMEQLPESLSQLQDDMRDETDPGAICRRVREDANALLEEAHALRDIQQEAFLAVLQWGGNLESATEEQRIDPQTGLHNRVGLETIHRNWLLQHPREPWSVAVLDIDHFGELNRRIGVAGGDRLLTAFGDLVDDLLRKESGFDRAGRCGDDSFVLFLGDTTTESAIHAVERIRQMIEASSFAIDNDEVSLTVSVGVAPGSGREILADVLGDALDAARESKEQGGNCTARHTEYGPQLEPPRPYEIRGRLVRVDDDPRVVTNSPGEN